MVSLCDHSWEYLSEDLRRCKKCNFSQGRKWFTFTGIKGTLSICNVCNDDYLTSKLLHIHKIAAHSI